MVSSIVEVKKDKHIAIVDLCGNLGEQDSLQLANEFSDACNETQSGL